MKAAASTTSCAAAPAARAIPVASRFFLSLEDDLMRIFGSERMGGMLGRLGLKEGEAIVHPWINKALEKAQKKVEARNFDMRKNVLKYDDVMNDQRREVYAQRREFMKAVDVSETVSRNARRSWWIANVVTRTHPGESASPSSGKPPSSPSRRLRRLLNAGALPVADWAAGRRHRRGKPSASASNAPPNRSWRRKGGEFGPEMMRFVEKSLLLQMLDAVWKEHLLNLDHLRQGIGLRAYGQRDPLNEYKTEAFALFNAMLDDLKERVTTMLSRVQLAPDVPPPADYAMPPQQHMIESHGDTTGGLATMDVDVLEAPRITTTPARSEAVDPDDPTTWGTVARNAACPCGSGKKFKHCHGRTA